MIFIDSIDIDFDERGLLPPLVACDNSEMDV